MKARKPCKKFSKDWSNTCQYSIVAEWIYLKHEGETKKFADEKIGFLSQYIDILTRL